MTVLMGDLILIYLNLTDLPMLDRNDHIVTLGFCLPVHPESANTVAMLNIAGNPIPKILTGGGDPVMKVRDFVQAALVTF